MRGSSGQSSEERRLGRPLHALAAVIALLTFLVFSSSAMASSAPAIESESVSGVSEHDATLEAQIETGGIYTGYQFEIDTNSSYNFTRFACPFSFPGSEQCLVIVDGEPLPAGLVEPKPQYIPAGSGEESVSLDLASIGATLQPDTTYHYRVTTSNGGQGAQGPDQTFTTPSVGSPAVGSPVIETLSASHVTQNDATVEAQINPEGLETTYELFMPEDPCNVPMECIRVHVVLAQGSIPTTATAESISLDLASKHVSMEAGERYGFVLIAKNSAGTVERHYSFRTLPKNTAPPSIDSDSVSGVTEHDATLEAQINTEGLQTSYQFHLWAICGGKGACQVVINYPLPSGVLLGSFVDQSVSLDLNTAGVTLQPGGQYFYSVTATSAGGTAGTSEGGRSFTTPELVVQPLNTTTSPLSATGSGTSGGSQSAASGSSSSSSTSAVQSSPDPLVVKTTKLEPLTNAEKLAKALKQCKKEPKRKRAGCEKQAHQKYALVAQKSKKG